MQITRLLLNHTQAPVFWVEEQVLHVFLWKDSSAGSAFLVSLQIWGHKDLCTGLPIFSLLIQYLPGHSALWTRKGTLRNLQGLKVMHNMFSNHKLETNNKVIAENSLQSAKKQIHFQITCKSKKIAGNQGMFWTKWDTVYLWVGRSRRAPRRFAGLEIYEKKVGTSWLGGVMVKPAIYLKVFNLLLFALEWSWSHQHESTEYPSGRYLLCTATWDAQISEKNISLFVLPTVLWVLEVS